MFRSYLRAGFFFSTLNKPRKRFNRNCFGLLSLLPLTAGVAICDDKTNDIIVTSTSQPLNGGKWIEGLPVYSKNDLEKHKERTSVWVRYKEGVYDITNFIAKHPGGIPRIMLAAGGAIDPFWNMYLQHMKPATHALLEEYRIGNYKMSDEERLAGEKKPDDPYSTDPDRNPALRVLSQRPFNAETPPVLLADSYMTPTELFFKRNHFPVPIINGNSDDFVVSINTDGVSSVMNNFQNNSSSVLSKPLTFSVKELKEKFEKHEVVSVIQCAGNRRRGFNKYKETRGLDWEGGAIGNTVWGGALLLDVLEDSGISHRQILKEGYKHVLFVGADKDPSTGERYIVSVPIEKVLSSASEVILAYEMGREALSRDHGGPLRVIVPGIVGARSVKWIERITFVKEESDSFWQKQDYRVLPETANLPGGKVDWKQAPPIYDTPVQSFICSPINGSEVSADTDVVTVKGYAFSGGGRAIVRVEVSIDGGQTWKVADLISSEIEELARKEGETQKYTSDGSHPFGYNYFNKHNLERSFGWTLWEKEFEIPDSCRGGELNVIARAVDSAYNLQVDSSEALWNGRGCVLTEQPRAKVRVAAERKDDDDDDDDN